MSKATTSTDESMSRALTTINGHHYVALAGQIDPQDMAALIRDNTGGAGLTARDLDRVKMPSGGSLAWEIPDLETPRVTATIEGIIVFQRDARVYWASSLEDSGGNQPPDCVSVDGTTGHGNPGGACDVCPNSAFTENDKGGTSQACKLKKQVFLLDPDSLFPLLVDLPPTSVAPLRAYMLNLVKRTLPYHGVVTRLGLEKAVSQSGLPYSKVKPQYIATLSTAEHQCVLDYRASILPHLSASSIIASQADRTE